MRRLYRIVQRTWGAWWAWWGWTRVSQDEAAPATAAQYRIVHPSPIVQDRLVATGFLEPLAKAVEAGATIEARITDATSYIPRTFVVQVKRIPERPDRGVF